MDLTLSSAAGRWTTRVGAGTNSIFVSCPRVTAGKQRIAVSPVKTPALPLEQGHFISFDPQGWGRAGNNSGRSRPSFRVALAASIGW